MGLVSGKISRKREGSVRIQPFPAGGSVASDNGESRGQVVRMQSLFKHRR